jgi:multidrug resistance efflux pump
MVSAVKAAYGESVKRGQVLARIQGRNAGTAMSFSGARARAGSPPKAAAATKPCSPTASSASRAFPYAGDRAPASAALAEKRAALRLAGMPEPGADGKGLSGVTEVRAAFDGVILDAPVQPGQRVDATAMLFKLGRIAPLWLEVQATPAQATGLAAGDTVSVPGCKGAGKLTLVAPHLNPATQSLMLRAEMGQHRRLPEALPVRPGADRTGHGGRGRRMARAQLGADAPPGQAWLFTT